MFLVVFVFHIFCLFVFSFSIEIGSKLMTTNAVVTTNAMVTVRGEGVMVSTFKSMSVPNRMPRLTEFCKLAM